MAQTAESPVAGAQNHATPDSTNHPRPGLLMLVLCMAEFIIVLDFSITNVALPSIQESLRFTAADLQWVVSAYALGFGGFLLLGGRISDLYGRRRLFIIGLIAFALVSLVAGFAQDATTLIVLRGLQGLCAAVVGPAALSLLTTSFAEGPARNKALGVYGAVLSFGFVAGVIAGGVLTELLDWRWVFFVNVPIALLTAAFAPGLVPRTPSSGVRIPLDIPGAVTVTGAAISLVYGISAVGVTGWDEPLTIWSFVAAAVLLIAFLGIEQRTRNPLVPLGIFRNRTLVAANIVNLLLIAAFVGLTYVLTLYLQRVELFTPLQTGLTFAVLGLTAMVAGFTAGKVAAKLGVTTALILGVLLQGLGALLAAVLPAEGGLVYVLVGTALVGFGDVLAVVMITISATAGVPDDQQGLAGGLLQTTQQLGAALGAAGFAAIAAAGTTAVLTGSQTLATADSAALVTGFRLALIISAVVAGVSALVGAALLLPAARRARAGAVA